MKDKQKIVVLVNKHTDEQSKEFLRELAETVEFVNIDEVDDIWGMKTPDIAFFSGGADVSPDYYGEVTGKNTHANKKRDEEDFRLWYLSRDLRIPLNVGICRGSQFVTVGSGGALIQHVEGHAGEHKITLKGTHNKLIATSTHHQMMFPYELNKENFELIAWSTFFNSSTYLNGKNEEVNLPKDFLEPEIVYYKSTNSLGIQGHPEFRIANKDYRNYCLRVINRKLESERTKRELEKLKRQHKFADNDNNAPGFEPPRGIYQGVGRREVENAARVAFNGNQPDRQRGNLERRAEEVLNAGEQARGVVVGRGIVDQLVENNQENE